MSVELAGEELVVVVVVVVVEVVVVMVIVICNNKTLNCSWCSCCIPYIAYHLCLCYSNNCLSSLSLPPPPPGKLNWLTLFLSIQKNSAML